MHTIKWPTKRGSKNGLFRTQIGLNITVSRALFHYGKIQIKCEGYIEEQIRQSHKDSGDTLSIITVLLPEKYKLPRPPAEFVGKMQKKDVQTHSL